MGVIGKSPVRLLIFVIQKKIVYLRLLIKIVNFKKMKILKFGGKSLANNGIDKVINIIIATLQQEPIAVVVSARANTNDELEML